MEELIEALIDWKVLVDWEEVLQLPSSTRNILYINHTALIVIVKMGQSQEIKAFQLKIKFGGPKNN